MFRTIDRYIIRELILPFCLGLLVFTFLLMIQPLAETGERLLAKGVSGAIVGRVLATLVPQALAVTIPMALLIGLLIGLGRLSADRESVALQACGISLYRLARPVLGLAMAAWAATSYIMVVAVPSANQTFREIVYGIVSARAESEIRPRVFFEDFPNRVLYVGDTPAEGGWRDVFLADTTVADQPTAFIAERGRLAIDRMRRRVDLVLEHGSRHTASLKDPATYEVAHFDHFIIALDPATVFPPTEILKGDNEMTMPELRARIDELRAQKLSPHGPIMALHRKFAIPAVCLVFGIIGLGLGLTSSRDSKLAAFVPGIAVIFTYYVIDYLGRQMAKGQLMPPALATWLPNLLLGAFGLALLVWRNRSAGRPIRLALPRWRRTRPAASPVATPATPAARPDRRVVVVLRLPELHLPRLRVLDVYVGRLFVTVSALTFVGLLGIFYISTFIDLSDKLFKGQTTAGMLAQYFAYATPQFVFYLIPLTVLIAAMVAIGVLTKTSELVVMKACGISLYRVAAPLLVSAVVASGLMAVLQERVLAYTNRRADAIRHVIRGGSPRTFDVVNRKWLVARNGDVYHYVFYDPRLRELNGLSWFRFGADHRGLATRTYVAQARWTPGSGDVWKGRDGWAREFTPGGQPRTFVTFPARDIRLEAPDYFQTESPDADRMTFAQLKRYIGDLETSGFNVVPLRVALHRKVAFPLVTLIMVLIAVPFAVTTGRRGALYGIAVGIVLAVSYWVAINTFGAIGSAGVMVPALAAWAPNLIFGAGAAYLLLTVRT